jgi:hypothetical protein
VGWRERDWAKFTDKERKALWGGGGHGEAFSTAGRGSGAPPREWRGRTWGPAPWASLAALVLLVVFLLGQLPRDNPLVPKLHIEIPGISDAIGALDEPQVFRLEGPKVFQQGGVYTIAGRTEPSGTGMVRVDTHWNAQPWRTVYAAPLSAGGTYQADIPLDKMGRLNIRVTLPSGDQVRGSLRVLP